MPLDFFLSIKIDEKHVPFPWSPVTSQWNVFLKTSKWEIRDKQSFQEGATEHRACKDKKEY